MQNNGVDSEAIKRHENYRIPVTRRRRHETKNSYIKRYTDLLYDSLPQTSLEERALYTEVRDKVIELNNGLFMWMARRKFVNCTYAELQDKHQAVITRFCECWTWYKFAKKYRTDLTFSVFYTPRIGEMLERDFNEVRYSLRRQYCMEVGDQIGKEWSDVTYEDLSNPKVKLSASHKVSLMCMFGTLHPGSLEDVSPFLEAPDDIDADTNPLDQMTEEYDDIVSLLIHAMIDKEKKLTKRDISKMSDMFEIPKYELESKVDIAEKELFRLLSRDVQQIEWEDK